MARDARFATDCSTTEQRAEISDELASAASLSEVLIRTARRSSVASCPQAPRLAGRADGEEREAYDAVTEYVRTGTQRRGAPEQRTRLPDGDVPEAQLAAARTPCASRCCGGSRSSRQA